MKRNVCLIACFTLLLFVFSNSAFAVEKIGFVNIPEVIKTSTDGKKAGEELNRFAEKKTAPLKSMQNELKKMKDDLDKQGSMMADAARRDKEAAYQKKIRDYQVLAQEVNNELQKKEQETFNPLIQDITKAINNIAEKEKFTAIFLVGIPNAPVAYYNKENDITSKVLEAFNKARK